MLPLKSPSLSYAWFVLAQQIWVVTASSEAPSGSVGFRPAGSGWLKTWRAYLRWWTTWSQHSSFPPMMLTSWERAARTGLRGNATDDFSLVCWKKVSYRRFASLRAFSPPPPLLFQMIFHVDYIGLIISFVIFSIISFVSFSITVFMRYDVPDACCDCAMQKRIEEADHFEWFARNRTYDTFF